MDQNEALVSSCNLSRTQLRENLVTNMQHFLAWLDFRRLQFEPNHSHPSVACFAPPILWVKGQQRVSNRRVMPQHLYVARCWCSHCWSDVQHFSLYERCCEQSWTAFKPIFPFLSLSLFIFFFCIISKTFDNPEIRLLLFWTSDVIFSNKSPASWKEQPMK